MENEMKNDVKEDVKKEVEQTKQSKSRKYIIIITILTLLLVSALGYIVYQDFIKEEQNKDEKNQEETNQPTELKKLEVYRKGKNGRYSISIERPSEDISSYEIFEITCETEDCKIKDNEFESYEFYGSTAVIVDDGDYTKIYNYETDTVIEKFKDIKDFDFHYFNKEGNEKYAIILKNSANKQAIYNYTDRKLIFSFEFDEIVEFGVHTVDIRAHYYDEVLTSSVIVKNDNKHGIINLLTGKIDLEIEYDNILCYQIYDYETKLIADKQYCTATKNEKTDLYEYSKTTKKLVNTNIQLTEFYDLMDQKHAFIRDESIVKLMNLETLEEITTFEDINLENPYFWSSMYNDGALIQYHVKDENFKCVEYSYNFETKEKSTIEDIECAAIAKPVLYLYPTEKTKVIVEFERPNILTTTYPKFKDKWEVTAYPNGDLYDSNGKYYYGLYWEEKPLHKVSFEEGFYVEKDNAIEFLEEKLSKIGLSDRERNEFIMYWLPILEKNGKNLVYFELTEERESYQKLKITPKPDSLLRVTMHVMQVGKKINIKEQKLKSFKRTGFTAVEWGGWNY